jgi:hypothetical protein
MTHASLRLGAQSVPAEAVSDETHFSELSPSIE